jgi:hypothetical protein
MPCTKKPFDKIEAVEAMYRARLSKSRKRRECRYYWCGACRAYHLTSWPLNDGRQHGWHRSEGSGERTEQHGAS